MLSVKALLAAALCVAVCNADMYLHNMRGSNNRLDEANRDRNNANRLFDSQNNNRGGSNVGSLYFYEGEKLATIWTNQHGCGNDYNDCQIIVQYMCSDLLRDGVTTRTIPDQPSNCLNQDCNHDVRFGMHEDYDYYTNCKYRFRNRGLFNADRNLNGNTARFTRQNNDGNRRGYECPEERDMYPYWHPTPWIDLAIFTDDASRCPFYQNNSENVKGRNYCALPDQWYHAMVGNGGNGGNGFIPNTKVLCERLNDPNSQMKQFLQAQALADHARVKAAAQAEFDTCQALSAECADLASDPPLHANCLKKFALNITVAELDAAISFCYTPGYVPKTEADCPVCMLASACPVATALAARNISHGSFNGCPSAAYIVDPNNEEYCILASCAATQYTVLSDDLLRYDTERGNLVAARGGLLIQSVGYPLCRSRVSLNADCIARSTKSANWTTAAAHNESLPWLQPPVCQEAQWSRPNHLGNGIGGEQNGFNFTIPPHFSEHCAMRVRYNITTGHGDYASLDPQNAGQVNATLNKDNGNNPAKIRVNAEHGIPMTDSDRPWENARGYLFRQNPQVEIFDLEVLVRYCNDPRAVIPTDATRCNVLDAAGNATGRRTVAPGVFCPIGHTAGVKVTAGAVVLNGACAATCLDATGAATPRLFCPADAGAQAKDFQLQLAINTNQFGRTFQDRSHSFAMRPLTSDLRDNCDTIYALNVRGKRGNIVQTYPGTEYDFTPNDLHVVEGECIHFQWTGSNTNPDNNDGQGKQGTDRHNIALQEKVRGEGGRGTQRVGGKGRNGATWTTAHMEPGWDGYVPDAEPSMADRSCEWKRTRGQTELYAFPHPLDWKQCTICPATGGNWVARPFTAQDAATGAKTFGACPAGFLVDAAVFGVSEAWCVRATCVPTGDLLSGGAKPVSKPRPMTPVNYTSGLDPRDPTFAGYPSSQLGTSPGTLQRGQWGMSHPDHFDNVTRDGFLGLTRDQLRALATLDVVQFRGEMSELDDAGTYFDMPVHKVSGEGTYHYLGTRNNNFSNRSQKGKIVVSRAPETSNLVGSPGGVVAIRTGGSGYIRAPATPQEQVIVSDYSVAIKPNSLRAAVPVELKVFPGVGMPHAASDVLWVGPAYLASVTTMADVKLAPKAPAGRRAPGAVSVDVSASFRVVSEDKIWFRVTSPAFAAKVAANPLANRFSFSLAFSSPDTPPFPAFSVELNNANELEGTWVGVAPEYVRAVEQGKMWVTVTIDNVEYMAQMAVVPNTGDPMSIVMPVSVTVQYGKVYYFKNRACVDNFVKGCEFERVEVPAVISGGQATFTRGASLTEPAGGFYQVSSGNSLPIIVGVTVACVVLAMAAVGAAVYFRKHPSEWATFKEYPSKKYVALQRSFASQV